MDRAPPERREQQQEQHALTRGGVREEAGEPVLGGSTRVGRRTSVAARRRSLSGNAASSPGALTVPSPGRASSRAERMSAGLERASFG